MEADNNTAGQDSSTGTTETTSDSSTDTPSSTTSSESTPGRASTAPDGEGEVSVDLDSVPEELRPHVEKFAKKHEQDFKRAYTKKFQELGAKERVWEQEKAAFQTEREQWKTIATEVLKNPKKLEALREVYGIQDPAEETSLPENVKTVGDLLAWQKQQNDALKEDVLQKTAEKVQAITARTRWDAALKSMAKDKQFAKYKNFIVQIAQDDPEVKSKWVGDNELEILQAAQEKYRAMLREDLEEIKNQTLAEQNKKTKASTAVPAKTTQMVPQGAKSRDEVIARVRAKLGPTA